jgi:hypothetical protein
MAEIVVEHGGMIDKFQGDAVMAVFGAPDRSTTTPSARSVRDRDAARQAELNARDGARTPSDARRRRRREHRQVIAGAIGGGGRLEYTVIGDAVNVASAPAVGGRGRRDRRERDRRSPRARRRVRADRLATGEGARGAGRGLRVLVGEPEVAP